MQVNPPNIAVVYLARVVDGVEALHRFVQSYRQYPAGVSHQLVVIFKGYKGPEDLALARQVFAEIPHLEILLPDEGFDIGSYFQAAEKISHQYVMFLNTFSEILCDDWLSKLSCYVTSPDVGLVGCTGSLQSLRGWMTLLQKIIFTKKYFQLDSDLQLQIVKYFDGFLSGGSNQSKPTLIAKYQYWRAQKELLKKVWQLLRTRWMRVWMSRTKFEEQYLQWWKDVQLIGDIKDFCAFPDFPNPHIRSNAFMMNRKCFLSLKRPSFQKKLEACSFESGCDSMTRQVLRSGLKAYVVGKDGKRYDLQQWKKSYTFRSGEQTNLIVADNQTRASSCAPLHEQFILEWTTWGEENLSFPSDFPKLGIRFRSMAGKT